MNELKKIYIYIYIHKSNKIKTYKETFKNLINNNNM